MEKTYEFNGIVNGVITCRSKSLTIKEIEDLMGCAVHPDFPYMDSEDCGSCVESLDFMTDLEEKGKAISYQYCDGEMIIGIATLEEHRCFDGCQ